MSLKVYCARAINGCSPDEVKKYYDTTTEILSKMGYTVLHPMVSSEYMRTKEEFKAVGDGLNPGSTNQAITRRDRWFVKECDILYLNLFNTSKVSIGSVSELSFAYADGKHSVLVLNKDNIHQHSFILSMADVIFETESEALQYLKDLTLNFVKGG